MDPRVGLAASTAVAIGLSMACSLCEAVLYSVPISVVRTGADHGDRRWRLMLAMKTNPARPIAGILITNTIANTAGATIAGVFAEKVFGNLGVSVFSALLVLAILWFSEILPKTIGVVYCRQLGALVAWPIRALVTLWYPFIRLTEWITRRIGVREPEGGQIDEWELAALLRQGVSDGAFRPQEARIVESVLRLDRLRVREIMTPRTVMVTLPADLPVAEAARHEAFLHHARIPIYEGEPDRVIGCVLRRDVLLADQTGVLRDLASPVPHVFELMGCEQLLDKFVTERRHLAMVIDEYGQIEGLVTLEDVLEALLGVEIVDESDVEPDLRAKAERLAAQRRESLGVTDDEPVPPEPPEDTT